jgi:hypothetical protein
VKRRRRTGAVVVGLALAAAAPAVAQRVLFVGNSFTASYGGLGEIVEDFARSRGRAFSAGQIAPGGFTLEQHFATAGTRNALATGGWDQVVLQEQSLRPVLDRATFERHGRLLAAEARTGGARPVFFLTWGQRSRPGDQAALTAAYCDLATELDARVAPVGLAWELARDRHPDIDLYLSDGSHPSPAGAYLAALVLYGALIGDSPLGLPAQAAALPAVPMAEAVRLQQIAADTLTGTRADGVPGRGACAFGPAEALVLNGGRFTAEVSWRDPFGGQGLGRSVPVTDDTGSFWFFDPANLELLVKVLDGRPVNGHFWVFVGALSNVEYTLIVTDRSTGRQRTYRNDQGELQSRADVAAFPDS